MLSARKLKAACVVRIPTLLMACQRLRGQAFLVAVLCRTVRALTIRLQRVAVAGRSVRFLADAARLGCQDTMMAKREHGVFWVVSTHVLTTGFVMPFLTFCAVNLLARKFEPDATPWQIFAIGLATQLLAYVGGTYYSLNYLRRVAIIRRPLACRRSADRADPNPRCIRARAHCLRRST